MIRDIKELWANKKELQGRLNITIFFVNVFLILTHLFLMFIYVLANHRFMIIVNAVSLLYYVLWFTNCYKHNDFYISFTFFEIWIHMLLGLVSFGWHASFQNWIFALIVATFLPSFKYDVYKPNYARSFLFTGIVVVSYFVFSVLIYIIPFKISVELSPILLRTIFTFNNMISFCAIILFAIFYTLRNETRVHELAKRAEYDELTSLYNRHALQEIGHAMKREAHRNTGYYSVAIIDIDFFKKINDTYGHTSGDLVLKELSNLLRAYSFKGICPGRWGGEEFIMIAPYSMEYNEFNIILEKLREKVEKTPFSIEGNDKINLTISIGVSLLTSKTSLDDGIALADKNLYKAKESGRNRVIA